jgi:hypothetical protein
MISKDDRFAPNDVFIIDESGEQILLDIKSTTGEFNQKIFASYNELKQMAHGKERYDIYRVYKIEDSYAMLRILEILESFP